MTLEFALSIRLKLVLKFGKRKSNEFKLYICFYKATREIEPGGKQKVARLQSKLIRQSERLATKTQRQREAKL